MTLAMQPVAIPSNSLKISVYGIVQGVGFRPFVYRLAHRYGLAGTVVNNGEGVCIHARG
jgi:hydrogenase maturation protein HypF